LSMVVLVNQLLTGIWLTMNFNTSSEGAFASVEYIMRDVNYGWILRYLHSTGASAFFIVVYLHMFRGLMYGSYRKPRELIWIFGMTIYVVLMAEGFMGYVLPWGQMSYWGANVIVGLFGAIPVIGKDLMVWIQGDYLISGATLNRFFALHVVALPLVLVGLVFLHILALHEVGSNNPDGVEIKKNKDPVTGIPLDGIPFHPYYTVHDLMGIVVFLFVFCFVVFFAPEMGGYFLEHANFEEANNLKTPELIAPVWYFTPFYSMLRACTYPLFGVDAKVWGLVTMASAIAILFVLPWLDRSPVKSLRYKGWFSRIGLLLFVACFIILGVLGTKHPTAERAALAQICTVYYFIFFLAMPWYTRMEKTTTPPVRLTGRLITIPQLVVVLALIAALTAVPLMAVGAEEAKLEPFKVNLADKTSLQSGAASFINYCMGCHSAAYSRYQRVADDLGIPKEIAKDKLLFDHDKSLGDLMISSMPKESAKNWFGIAPPDLSLVARARSPEWLQGYLKGFYLDASRPFGVNNEIFKNVGMPNVLGNLQGQQLPCKADACTGTTHVDGTGTMSAEEFDKFVYDLVNFLTYLGEPAAMHRETIGAYVLFFLAFLFVFAYMLNREYWKDVH